MSSHFNTDSTNSAGDTDLRQAKELNDKIRSMLESQSKVRSSRNSGHYKPDTGLIAKTQQVATK